MGFFTCSKQWGQGSSGEFPLLLETSVDSPELPRSPSGGIRMTEWYTSNLLSSVRAKHPHLWYQTFHRSDSWGEETRWSLCLLKMETWTWWNPVISIYIYLENKLLLISINFTPKTSHSCLQFWYAMFSRYIHLLWGGPDKTFVQFSKIIWGDSIKNSTHSPVRMISN